VNFRERSAMFMARGHALNEAAVRERRLTAVIKLSVIGLNVVVIALLWYIITVKLLILLQAGVIVLSVAVNRVFFYAWVKPTMARINRECPKP